jgi:hypothetical protein
MAPLRHINFYLSLIAIIVASSSPLPRHHHCLVITIASPKHLHLALNYHHRHHTHNRRHFTYMARTRQTARLSTGGSARRVLLKRRHATPLANPPRQDAKPPDLQVSARRLMSICHVTTVIFYSIVLCVKTAAIYGNVTTRIVIALYVLNALKFPPSN